VITNDGYNEMPFDNRKFTAWLAKFERVLVENGIPEHQAKRYRGEYYDDAVAHYSAGLDASEAATRELLNACQRIR
jgi:hypothetical protein